MKSRSGFCSAVFWVFVIAGLIAIPAFVGAQCVSPGDDGNCPSSASGAVAAPSDQSVAAPSAYGTEASTILLVQSGGITPIRSEYTYSQSFGWRWCDTGSNCWFDVSLDIPSGVIVDKVEVEAYDDSSADEVWVWFYACNLLEADCSNSYSATTSGTPEYTTLELDLSSEDITVDKSAYTYSARVRVGGDSDTQFRSVRVYYTRQISPAPASATFSDVPMSFWAFQQIEAMAASGITVGCAPDLYCPNDNVTRAEMAVFFSRALGLHWPN